MNDILASILHAILRHRWRKEPLKSALGRCLGAALAALFLAIASHDTGAQSYPSRPIRLVIPYPPGGGADNVARVFVDRLSQELGAQVLIDNRGGAAGIIGADVVAKSKPDGYTLLDDSSSRAVNPWLRKLPFDTLKDFAPIGMIVVNPNFLVVHPSLPVTSVRDLVGLARAHPGQIAYASSGVGSAPHLGGALFEYLAKVKMLHVPYKGGGPALADLVGGQVQVLFPNIASGLPHVRAGRLRGIAVTSTKRSRAAAEFPTMAESGLPSFELSEWNALFAPAGTAPETIAKVNAALVKVIAAAEIRERLFQIGAEPSPGSPQELDQFVRKELARWGKIIKEVGIKLE
ncbi:MAG: tripartite tricarboxylate transporter substrate binding protein [Burkholderiales bacterium]|nr:tripartite tricarboxylate transporter substrate binding protein [Burkholderiales bacterium]